MPATETIAAINREQLATATDRLLVSGRVAKRASAQALVRPRGPVAPPQGPLAVGSQPNIVLAALQARRSAHPAPPARGAWSYAVVRPSPSARGSRSFAAVQPSARGSAAYAVVEPPAYEITVRTVPVRRRSALRTQMFAVLVAIPALAGIAVGLAALL